MIPRGSAGDAGRRSDVHILYPPGYLANLVRQYLAEAGIPDASTHALRHTFAMHHVTKGTKLDVGRQALGHESLATTSVYVGLPREVMDRELQQNALLRTSKLLDTPVIIASLGRNYNRKDVIYLPKDRLSCPS